MQVRPYKKSKPPALAILHGRLRYFALPSTVTEVDDVALDAFNKLGFLVIFRVVAAACDAPEKRQASCFAESCSQIADDVTQYLRFLHLYDLVVESPVGEERIARCEAEASFRRMRS
jgi:hypothetical protein